MPGGVRGRREQSRLLLDLMPFIHTFQIILFLMVLNFGQINQNMVFAICLKNDVSYVFDLSY